MFAMTLDKSKTHSLRRSRLPNERIKINSGSNDQKPKDYAANCAFVCFPYGTRATHRKVLAACDEDPQDTKFNTFAAYLLQKPSAGDNRILASHTRRSFALLALWVLKCGNFAWALLFVARKKTQQLYTNTNSLNSMHAHHAKH